MPKAIGIQAVTDLSGLDAIERTAKRRAVTRKAVRAGAKLVQAAAKARAPRRKGSGALRQSLGIKTGKGAKGKTLAYAVIGARTKVERVVRGKTVKPSKYAHLVEKGTRAHDVAGRRHPGARPKPFLKPALDTQREAIRRVVLDVLAEGIADAVRKQSLKRG